MDTRSTGNNDILAIVVMSHVGLRRLNKLPCLGVSSSTPCPRPTVASLPAEPCLLGPTLALLAWSSYLCCAPRSELTHIAPGVWVVPFLHAFNDVSLCSSFDGSPSPLSVPRKRSDNIEDMRLAYEVVDSLIHRTRFYILRQHTPS